MNKNGILRRSGGVLMVAAVALATAACPDGETLEAVPGSSALLVLETPGTDEGALLFTLDGPARPTVATVSGSHQVFTRDVSGNGLRVAVIGDLAAGAVLVLELPEGEVAEYDAVLEQVADRQNRLRPALGAYELVIRTLGD